MDKHISEMTAYDVMIAMACNHKHIMGISYGANDTRYPIAGGSSEQSLTVLFDADTRMPYAGRKFRIWKDSGKLEEL